ncbi:MAG: hypothetical protein QXK12_08515 [Candidatus Nezhaarchaeales archaeon]
MAKEEEEKKEEKKEGSLDSLPDFLKDVAQVLADPEIMKLVEAKIGEVVDKKLNEAMPQLVSRVRETVIRTVDEALRSSPQHSSELNPQLLAALVKSLFGEGGGGGITIRFDDKTLSQAFSERLAHTFFPQQEISHKDLFDAYTKGMTNVIRLLSAISRGKALKRILEEEEK